MQARGNSWRACSNSEKSSAHCKTRKQSITSVTFCAILCPIPASSSRSVPAGLCLQWCYNATYYFHDIQVIRIMYSTCCNPDRSVFCWTEVSAWRMNCIRTANLSQSFRESCLCDYNRTQCISMYLKSLIQDNSDSNWSCPSGSVLELQACGFFA